MILQSIVDYILKQGRVEEHLLLAHFHLTQEGLAPMMEVLIKSGKIHKTIHSRGEKLSPLIYYRVASDAQIPSVSII